MVLTDYSASHGYQNADQITRDGGDLMFATIDIPISTVNVQDVAGMTVLRGASYSVLYTVANSWMYENSQPEATRNTWEYITRAAAGVLILSLLGFEVYSIRRYHSRRAQAVITVEPNMSIGETGFETVEE